MGKKRNLWKWITLVFVIAVIGAAGILIGRRTAGRKCDHHY